MHTPVIPAAHMMPSTGALMDPGYLRDAVEDASERAHARRSQRTIAPMVVLKVIAWVRAAAAGFTKGR